MEKAEILAAIRHAAQELGRAPSRGELKRLTGVSHYRVLTEFRSLREAVRTAGLEPSRKGEKIATEELIKDWERVRKKLGRRPSRAEYVREGRYSAGTFVMRFGSWGKISTAKGAHSTPLSQAQGRSGQATEHGGKARGSRESTRRTRSNEELPEMPKSKRRTAEAAEKNGSRSAETAHRIGATEKAIAFEWAASLAAIPAPLEGKRRVTEAVAAMVVGTLLGPKSGDLVSGRSGDLKSYDRDQIGRKTSLQPRGIYKGRPVMGPPFSRHPLTNAPVNEMGVVFLFALVAWDLGFQVESLWSRGEPDGRAKREVAPGKWQDVAIEFEYESKNFVLHGHDPKKCDVIVCWRHNWKDAPPELEIIELCRLFG